MSPTYAQNKKHIYKWVENNKDRAKELCNNRVKRHYQRRKLWKDASTEFLLILLDPNI